MVQLNRCERGAWCEQVLPGMSEEPGWAGSPRCERGAWGGAAAPSSPPSSI